MASTKIAPSILAADFTRLHEAIEFCNQAPAVQYIHCDVMDGHFVPNISFGLPVLKAIKPITQKPLDVHLMIAEPDRYLEAFREAGADILTVHYEACPHLHRTLESIRALGMRAGVALNPHTTVTCLEEVLPITDLVCLMSVNPGFGGQQFIQSSLQKSFKMRQLIQATGSRAEIELDGGVTNQWAAALVEAGATTLVAGSYLFGAPDTQAALGALLDPLTLEA